MSDIRARKFATYGMPGFAVVEPGDVVVDAGAFVGEFSIPAAAIAQRVVSVEASPDTFVCLQENLRLHGCTSALPVQRALWNRTEELTFHLAEDATDNSIIGEAGEAQATRPVTVQAERLDGLMARLGIDRVDFFKLDAEGAEPEVVEGMGDLDVSKMAIDCGPERRGESTHDMVRPILESRGYEVRIRRDLPNILVARRRV